MEQTLTIEEAYLAMIAYLEKFYNITHSDDIGGMLGSMQFMYDGGTFDPAYWNDWLAAVQQVKKSN